MSVHRTLPDIRSHRKEQTDSIITFFNDTDMMRFFEKLKESLQELRKELEQTTEAIKRLGTYIEALNTPSRHDRRFPLYREKLNPRGHVRPIFWHRIRSNPHRKRKPH